MAIEHYNESEQPDPESGDDSETTEIPASIIGDQTVEPGDVIRLEVVSNDPDSEMIVVKYAEPKKAEPVGSSIDKAASNFEA